jgi:hypothetical protein
MACGTGGRDAHRPRAMCTDDPYCFEKDIKVYHPSGKVTDPGYIDFYKADHFIIEAKQGSDQTGQRDGEGGAPPAI